MTLERDCRRDDACFCLMKTTTGELQALGLVGFADQLVVYATTNRSVQSVDCGQSQLPPPPKTHPHRPFIALFFS